MIYRKFHAYLLLFLFALFASLDARAETVDKEGIITLEWQDLIPLQERNRVPTPRPSAINHDSDTPPQQKLGGVRQDLDGKKVRMPGFVIPLEGDNNVVTEFLLVPYFGACIHVPPPPPNQIVDVRFVEGAPIKELWQTVYVVGVLKTETVNRELGETAYVIDGIRIEPYKE
ncbi:DUF3299 domain-containing protein [Vibrio viridaestus]|uniref:DUF3299 domain-containing protein n=1 Tax=Vibrio viridaestus TaxID=2487322 RepID=A0A3N9U5W5_9VIBR|nr:DUF3299 domain-containing protein [Vibrio viridaestus]RQW65122.1 DUF3299 domain-containing protein [Vibrio viridaestus]